MGRSTISTEPASVTRSIMAPDEVLSLVMMVRR